MNRMHASAATAVAFLAVLTVLTGIAGAGSIWREGEDATTQGMNPHPRWYDKVKTEELSGGKWLSNFSKTKEGTATYDVAVAEAGTHTLWLRANPIKSKLSYRLDGAEWAAVDFTKAVDNRNVAADEKPDLRFIAWVKVGAFALSKGEHTLHFRMHGGPENHGAIDAFVLTTEDWTPAGKARPGDATAGVPGDRAPEIPQSESWSFRPPKDEFTDEAVIDLRDLNERFAGEHGFVRRGADGADFVRGDGKPLRFWAVHGGPKRMTGEQMDRHCRFLAKLGVNLIRFTARVAPTKEGMGIDEIDEKGLDHAFRFVKAAKDNGIYVVVNPYWYYHAVPTSWGLAGYKKGDWPTGAMFFNEKFKNAYKAWVRALYTRTNPHTKTALKDEPAVAVIQVKNEDSLLFYTSQRFPREQQLILARQWAQWLTRRYGSLAAAQAAWDGVTIADGAGNAMGGVGDAGDDGVMGMYIIWEMTQKRSGGMDKRLTDQMEFMAAVQHGFYGEIHRFFRETLGCKQLTNAMNWKSADKLTTDDVERWTYTACDVMAVNRYAGGIHVGENNGYRIDPGHYLTNRSITRHPLQLPTNLKQVAGRPFLITESAWVHPNLYQTEGPFLAAAYMSLTGVDSLCWFSQSEVTWLEDPRRMFWKVGDSYALHKWSGSVPQQIGMFPANALLFRKGFLKRGDTVVHEERPLGDLWRRKQPILAETESFDPIRDAKDLREQTTGKTAVSRLAFLVGPVEVVFGGDPSRTRVADLTAYIDGEAKIVRANTGEIDLDYGVGLCRMNAPKAQGVAGFLKAAGGTFSLRDVTIRSDNDYAAIQLVPLDDKPLGESRQVLVQVGTVARLTGWTTKPDTFQSGENLVKGERIVNTGRPPWRIAHTRATIRIRNAKLRKATRLDVAGYRAENVPVAREGDALSVDLPRNTMYLVLE